MCAGARSTADCAQDGEVTPAHTIIMVAPANIVTTGFVFDTIQPPEELV